MRCGRLYHHGRVVSGASQHGGVPEGYPRILEQQPSNIKSRLAHAPLGDKHMWGRRPTHGWFDRSEAYPSGTGGHTLSPPLGYFQLAQSNQIFPTPSGSISDPRKHSWAVCDPEAAVLSSFCRRLEAPRRNTAGDIAAGSSRALGHTPFSLGHSRRADGMGAGCGRRWPAVPQACYWVATPAVARA